MKTTLADLRPTDTFRWADASMSTPLMTVVSSSDDAVVVERADGRSPFGPAACKPEALVEPMGA